MNGAVESLSPVGPGSRAPLHPVGAGSRGGGGSGIRLIRELARRLAVWTLGNGIPVRWRLRRLRQADPLVILMIHRVGPPDGSAYRPLNAALFEELLRFVTRHFSLVTFADSKVRTAKPRMILSFDDGYRDFIEVAMPLLRKHRIMANLNVIPSCVESGLPPLQVLTADFLGKAPTEVIRRVELPGFDMCDRHRLRERLDLFLRGRPHREQRRISDLLVPQFFAWAPFRPTPMMSREEVRQAAGEHEIGAHSFDHVSMANETDAYLIRDVARCRAWFEAALERRMRIYVFPNGSCRPGQPNIVRDAGIDHVLLSGGTLGEVADGVADRVGVDSFSRRELRFRAVGARARIESACEPCRPIRA